MQKTNWINIAQFIIKKPFHIFTLIEKVYLRLTFISNNSSVERLKKDDRLVKAEEFAKKIDPELWQESYDFAEQFKKKAASKLQKIEYNLGGGGIYPLLYFLTRHFKANIVVETGVASGFSSQAFLAAMEVNKEGILYSSDLPYFRLPNPEEFVGLLVDDNLKTRWRLYLDGDKKNLANICSQINHIDIFHYDSDKSYLGRKMAMSMLSDKLTEKSIIIMDDIQDNSYFFDYLEAGNISNYFIFEFGGKYVGLIADI